MASLTTPSTNSFRDVSFSSYLDGWEEKFIHKLPDLSRSLGKTGDQLKGDDGEIGIFTADKYFSGGIEVVSPRLASISKRKPQQSQRLETDVVQTNGNSDARAGTPSVQSESSWNSQSSLVKSIRKNSMQQKAAKVNGRSFFAILGCKCLDKASVEVDDHIDGAQCPGGERFEANLDLHQKQCSGSWIQNGIRCQDSNKLDIELNGDVRTTFPSSNSMSGISPIKIKHLDEDPIPRKSIEVFGSPIHVKRNKSSSLDRKLNMFPWEATPRMESLEFSVKHVHDGNESDASSDLFEIESLTGKVVPFLSRQESEANSGCLSPNNYAPSEASIEWSVVTASAADFSVMSDYEEIKLPANNYPNLVRKTFPTLTSAKTRTNKETPRQLPSISLGCKSQKSVSVAGDAYRANDKASVDSRNSKMSEQNTATTRFQAERKLTAFTTYPLPTTRLPRTSHRLYL